jgi:hypothetical protein
VGGAAGIVPIEHESSDRVVRAMGFVLPPAALCLAGWLTSGGALQWQDLLVLAIGYTFTGLGVTVGCRRLFTHRSFVATRPMRALPAVLDSVAGRLTGLLWGGAVRVFLLHRVTERCHLAWDMVVISASRQQARSGSAASWLGGQADVQTVRWME